MKGYGDENTLHVIFSWKEVAKLIVLVDEGVKVVKKWKVKDEKTRRRVHRELDKFRDELIEIAKNATVKPETHKLSDHPCLGCPYAVYSEEGFIDACDLPPGRSCPRGYRFERRS